MTERKIITERDDAVQLLKHKATIRDLTSVLKWALNDCGDSMSNALHRAVTNGIMDGENV